MSNDLVSFDTSQLPTQLGDDAVFAEMAKGKQFLGTLKLYTKGRGIDRGLVSPGEFGIPRGEQIIRLGQAVDVLVCAKRPKALDINDTDAIIEVFDAHSEIFQEIKERSFETNSKCMFGPSFLVYERTTADFYEFFCGSKSTRTEAGNIYPYCPLSQEQIDSMAERGLDVDGLEPHGPLPMTMKSKFVERNSWSWHVPIVLPCSTPFDTLPKPEQLNQAISNFLSAQPRLPEVVDESEVSGRRAR